MDIIQLSMFDGKACIKCGTWKSLDSFDRNPKTRDRRIGSCKDCARLWRQARGGLAAEAARRWREQNRERFFQSRRERNRRNYKPHPRVQARMSEEQQRERRHRYNQEWNARNPEQRQIIRQAYRARKKRAGGAVTKAEWQQLCDFYGNQCLCCGSHESLSVDHVIPLSKGGAHSIENIQPLCGSCNSRKHNKHIDYRSVQQRQKGVQY